MPFVSIKEREMDRFLKPKGFKVLDLEGTTEKVYGKRVDKDGEKLSLRIYSSINPNGIARERGSDAIRVEMFRWDSDKGEPVHVGHSKRVNRIHTWRKNLAKRLNRVDNMVGPKCPNCGDQMVLRGGKNGNFWGCSNYHSTGCGGTRQYKD